MNHHIQSENRKTLIKNLMATAVTPPPEGFADRLAYWRTNTGIDHPKCAHEVCCRPATEGAIGRRAFSPDTTLYVYPACETCARRTEMLYVTGPLIPLPR